MTVQNYNLTARNGKHIRVATKVILDDGREIRFMERMTKDEALKNVAYQYLPMLYYAMKKWTPSEKTSAYVLKRARKALKLYEKYGSKMEVARLMGVNPSTVYRWFSFLGIPNTGTFKHKKAS